MSDRRHYAATPLELDAARTYNQNARSYKPSGFWWSVGDSWAEWCQAEDYRVSSLAHIARIDVDESRLLRLSGANDIDVFTERYSTERYPSGRGIDWQRVAERWGGIEIAPYCWDRRMASHTFWYYGWDCASGVAWDLGMVSK